MYTIATNVQLIIALLKEHGINHLVLNPGGTNAAFVRGVQNDSFFKCHSIVDERSAMYFAIGLYLATGTPVATCCTSAQATRNYIPGLTEAFYKRVPILAITFSKHPKFTYQEYMQAPDQTSLPKDSVKSSFSLPYISNRQDRLLCERLINEAILELTHRDCGPIQLNVPMLDTELTQDGVKTLPSPKKIVRIYKDEIDSIDLSEKKILIAIGENCKYDKNSLEYFSNNENVAIYVNNISNYRGQYSFFGNHLLSTITQKEFDTVFCPDILITIGGQTGDYPLFHKLSESKRCYEHWRVSPSGEVIDTYDHLTRVYECKCDDFFRKSKQKEVFHDYYQTWNKGVLSIKIDIELPLSNALIAQQLHAKIPSGSVMHFAILNSLRIWNLFPLKNDVKCFSNVAAFGIDGCMSTFIGQSVMTDTLCYLVTGDLAFFYDMNALGIKYIKSNIRIILINNNGGIEFKLGGDAHKNKQIDRYIAASGHFRNAEGWAKTNRFAYYAIRDISQINELSSVLTNPSQDPIFVEVFTTDINESTAYSLLVNNNQKRSILSKIYNRLFKY